MKTDEEPEVYGGTLAAFNPTKSSPAKAAQEQTDEEIKSNDNSMPVEIVTNVQFLSKNAVPKSAEKLIQVSSKGFDGFKLEKDKDD